jgi:thiol:disulfide interchange protein
MPAPDERMSGTSRPLPRVLLVIAAALLVARVATGVWEQRHPPKTVERVTWVDPSGAESESRRTGKPILYEFGAEWCVPCQVLSREVFADAGSALRIEQTFVPVRVTDRQQEEGRNPPAVERLERTYRIDAFPTLVVAWPGSARFETISGFRGRQETMSWLTTAAARVKMRAMGFGTDSIAGPR